MLRKIATAAVVLMLFAGAASAQTCSAVPNILTNGTTADATQVMANFNAVLACIGGLRGYLGGLTMSNDGTSPNTVIDTSAGMADSDDATTMMTLTVFTKNADTAWASGAGNGCLDAGASLVASQWYHLYVIENPTSGVADELCSESATSPTMPSGYTKKRRIGSFRTNSSADILAFSQNGNEFLWHTPVSDVVAAATTAGNTLNTLTVPTGIRVNALFIGQVSYLSGPVWGDFWSPDSAPSPAGSAVLANVANSAGGGEFNVRTNTAAQIYSGFNGTTGIYYINTFGWVDTRGQ